MKKFWKRTEGFTLVELIVVIAILGILAGVGTVGYSGYIKKANMAADEILLDSLNTAFAAACIENQTDATKLSETPTLTWSGKTVSGVSVFEDDFLNYYEEDSEFKVTTASDLVFVKELGAFVNKNAANSGFAKVTYRGVDLYLSQADIDTFKVSDLGALGAELLLTETADVVNFAQELNLASLGGEAFYSALYGYLGVDLSKYDLEDEEDAARAQAEYDAAMERLVGTDETLQAEVVANAIAIYAAQNSSSVTTNSISQWLSGDSDTDDFKDSNTATTLSEAAAIYGLYIAYQGDSFNTSDAPMNVLSNALTDESFATWVSTDPTAQTELEAYKAAMSMVTDASQSDAIDSVLKNGFADEELIKVFDGLLAD